MKNSDEVRKELHRLIQQRKHMEETGEATKAILLTMRIDALKWVLNEE